MSLRVDRICFTLLLVMTIFTALAHGAVEPWSVALFEWMCVLLLFLTGVKTASEVRLSLPIPTTLWPLLAILLLGLLQSFAWTDAAGQRQSLSFDVEATRATVLQLFLLFVCFITAAHLIAQRDLLEMWQRFAVCFGGLLALFALVQHFAWDGKFFWLRPAIAEDITAPFGPFVHHAHFAGYIEMLLPLPLALLITREISGAARLIYGSAAALMIVAALFSRSRGGTLGLIVELIYLGVAGAYIARRFSSRPPSGRRYHASNDEEDGSLGLRTFMQAVLSRLGAIAALCLVLLAGLWWIGAEPILNRFVRQGGLQSQNTNFYATRGWIWRDTLRLIQANPLVGVGLGAYETAVPQYSRSDGSLTVNAAHNDYLQVLADGGLIGGLLVLWFFVLLFRQLKRGVQSRDPLRAGLALGCSTAIVGMLVHSFFDFHLHLPAHALLFLTLAAVSSELGAVVPQAIPETVAFPEPTRQVLVGATRSMKGTTS